MPKLISIDSIRTDAGTQCRVSLDQGKVAEYAEQMRELASFPPLDVFHDGSEFFLADGFHRLHAAIRIGATEISCTVHKGALLEAIKFALGANAKHGLARSNADKRRCVEIALKHFGELSDRGIAEMCGVHWQLVGTVRSKVDDSSTSNQTDGESETLPPSGAQPQIRVGRDGKKYHAKKKRPSHTKPAIPTEGFITALSSVDGCKFGCIYADPPWKYGNQSTRAATDNHYDTMTVDEICALPIGDLAADKCHLHMWTTNGFLFEAPRIFAAWGFEFKSSLVWVKPQMGIGNYWRNSHEILLLAVRGGLTAQNRSQMSWLEHRRGKHSEKPEEVRRRIEAISPGPRLELFGRGAVDGWTVFGNQNLKEKVLL